MLRDAAKKPKLVTEIIVEIPEREVLRLRYAYATIFKDKHQKFLPADFRKTVGEIVLTAKETFDEASVPQLTSLVDKYSRKEVDRKSFLVQCRLEVERSDQELERLRRTAVVFKPLRSIDVKSLKTQQYEEYMELQKVDFHRQFDCLEIDFPYSLVRLIIAERRKIFTEAKEQFDKKKCSRVSQLGEQKLQTCLEALELFVNTLNDFALLAFKLVREVSAEHHIYHFSFVSSIPNYLLPLPELQAEFKGDQRLL